MNHDPLNVLHAEDLPVQPDPAFAARLRGRLESALTLPHRTEGVEMSNTDAEIAALNEPSADELIQHGDIGYVSVWVPDQGPVNTYAAPLDPKNSWFAPTNAVLPSADKATLTPSWLKSFSSLAKIADPCWISGSIRTG